MFRWITGLCAVACIVACLGVIFYQVFSWFRFDVWIPMPLWKLFQWLNFDFFLIAKIKWFGVQQIIWKILGLPLSMSLLFFGFIFGIEFGFLNRLLKK